MRKRRATNRGKSWRKSKDKMRNNTKKKSKKNENE
jgi:hypothetical protein